MVTDLKNEDSRTIATSIPLVLQYTFEVIFTLSKVAMASVILQETILLQ